MRSGRLRHRLLLQQPTRSRTATGAFTTTWGTTATVWGAVEALSGREFWESSKDAGQINAETKARIVIRYGAPWSGIDTTWRIKDAHSGTTWDIESVIQPEARSRPDTMIEIMAKSGKTDDE